MTPTSAWTDTLDERVEFDEESQDLVYGAGIGANIGEKFNLRFEYEKFDLEGLDDADALWLTAGLAVLMRHWRRAAGGPALSASAPRAARLSRIASSSSS